MLKVCYKYIITLILVAAVAFSLILSAAPALAHPGLKVSGAILVTDVAPGGHITHTITVSTRAADPPMEILAEVRGFGQSLDGTSQELVAGDDTSPYSARTFLTTSPSSFHLDPGGSQDVTLSGTIPADVGAGGRYAIVYIHSLPTGTGEVGVVSAIDVPILLIISGTELTKTGIITDLSIAEVTSAEPVNITAILRNSGNYHYKALAEATLKDGADNILGTASTPLTTSSIIPTYARQFKISLAPTEELPLGTYYVDLQVTLEDDTVVDSRSTSFEITAPYVPPSISEVVISDITTDSASVSWTTNKPATSQLEYGLTSAYGLSTPLDTNLVTDHHVSLTGLTGNTTYHLRVKSTDVAGEEVESPDYNFTTAAMVVLVSLPTEQSVSDQTEVKDTDGNAVALTGDTITTTVTLEGKTKFTLPIALAEDQTLSSFSDPESGMTFLGNRLTIPIKDTEGNTVMSIVAETEEVKGTGTTAEVVVKKMELKSEDFEADLSTVDSDVGEVGASFSVELKSIPENAFVKTSISKAAEPLAQSAFQLAATDAGTEIADIAYTLNIERINLENETHLGEATMTMKVGRAWAESYGIDKIKIFRYTEEGERQILPTSFKGYEGDQAVFEAISPDGLSIFGVVALTSPLPTPAAISWALMAGIIGGVVVVGLLGYFIIRRRRGLHANSLGIL